MATDDLLAPAWWRFLADARTATLTTLDPDGRPASVPICFIVLDAALWSPLDEKPKRSADPRTLRRVRNLIADPRATILVHRWDEDWGRLAFVSLDALGQLVEPDSGAHARATSALRAKYPQYADHDLEGRPSLRLEPTGATTWGTAD